MIRQTFPADYQSIEDIQTFVKDGLRYNIENQKSVNPKQFELLIEEMTVSLIDHALPDADITVEINRSLTQKYNLVLSCPGSRINFYSDSDRENLSSVILSKFRDQIDYTDHHSINVLTLTGTTDSNRLMKYNVIALLLALALAGLSFLICDGNTLHTFAENILDPIINGFSVLMQTFAMPTAFFAIVTYLVAMFKRVNHTKYTKKLIQRYLFTSVIAIIIGTCFSRVAFAIVQMDMTEYTDQIQWSFGSSFAEIFQNLIPSDLTGFLSAYNPVPMLVAAIIFGIAIGNIYGDTGDRLERAFDGCSALFSKILNLIYTMLPLFLLITMVDDIFYSGFPEAIQTYLISIVIVGLTLVCIILFYGITLLCADISPLQFWKNHKTIIIENFKIGSNIGALPYNKRALKSKYKNRITDEFLQNALDLGVLMNMDGNCVTIAAYSSFVMLAAGIYTDTTQLMVLSLIILLISFGAPNEPGSFMVCTAILIAYLGIDPTAITTIIFIEAFFGKFYSFVNSLGDLVAIDITVKRMTGEAEICS